MSLGSDTEGPPPEPLHPSLSCRTNPDIREEDGEGDPTPCLPIQNGPTCSLADEDKPEMDRTKSESGGEPGEPVVNDILDPTKPKSEAAAGLNYDSVKYTLVVDEHAQLELVKLKDCLHGPTEDNEHEDSDTETVYQSANEEEDPEYEQERRRSEDTRKLGNKIVF